MRIDHKKEAKTKMRRREYKTRIFFLLRRKIFQINRRRKNKTKVSDQCQCGPPVIFFVPVKYKNIAEQIKKILLSNNINRQMHTHADVRSWEILQRIKRTNLHRSDLHDKLNFIYYIVCDNQKLQ